MDEAVDPEPGVRIYAASQKRWNVCCIQAKVEQVRSGITALISAYNLKARQCERSRRSDIRTARTKGYPKDITLASQPVC